jgi:type IV pilus assembly protein PilO
MALLPQNPRSQRLLIVGVLAIGLAGVYEQLVWAPKNDALAKIATHVDTLDSLNAFVKREAAKGSTAKMKGEAEAYNRELVVLRRLVPTSNEVPALLESVSSAARDAGLELSDVQPDGVVEGDQFDTYRYKIDVSGPYHKVARFLANVGSLPRIVEPMNLSLATTTVVREIKPARGEQLLDARFEIQTYVAHASAKASKASFLGGKAAP